MRVLIKAIHEFIVTTKNMLIILIARKRRDAEFLGILKSAKRDALI